MPDRAAPPGYRCAHPGLRSLNGSTSTLWSVKMTTILTWLSPALAATACLVLNALPAHALNTKSWVSGAGLDTNACTRAAPCLTFAHALTQTNAGGSINCLDQADYGTLTIDKSITIDCTGTFAGVLA